MNHALLLKKIKEKARQDARKRADPRFRRTMGFLVAKGFLQTNYLVPLTPNARIDVDEAIWAGKNVEPRILEVLPAAIARLGEHFDLDTVKHAALARIVAALRDRNVDAESFFDIPFQKVAMWADFPLKDGRVKTIARKKVMKTFRLTPITIETLRKIAEQFGCSETEALEQVVAHHKIYR